MRRASVIIMTDNKGDILWQLRDANPPVPISYPGYWNLPSGGWEEVDREDIRNTAVRELGEETGYIARPEDFTELFTSVQNNPVKGPIERHILHIAYDGQQEIRCLEGERMEFHPVEEMGGLPNIYTDHIDFVKRYQAELFSSKERKG